MKAHQKYKAIAAWGRMLRSNGSYVLVQQQVADRENAPLNAIYKDSDDGHWHTVDDITNANTRKLIDKFLEDEKGFHLP